MRLILLVPLLLAACSKQPADAGLASGTFAGTGRDRLCIAGQDVALRAGLIVYGQGDVNCSAAGKLERAGQGWVLVPQGEGDCRIPLEVKGDSVMVGKPPAACAYYCGPAAVIAGMSFARSNSASKAVDLAGDALC